MIAIAIISLLLGVIGVVFTVPKSRHYVLRKFSFLNPKLSANFSILEKKTVVRGLEINLNFGNGSFNKVEQCFFLEFIFYNNTGSKVHISNLRIADVSSLLKINPEADKNINDNSYSLKFIEEVGFLRGAYSKREITIDTNAKVKTGIPLSNEYTESDMKTLIKKLKQHTNKPNEIKYFVLKYYAKIGVDKSLEVEFNY